MKDAEQLKILLRSFHLSSFVRNCEDFAAKAEKQKLGHLEYLYELSHTEAAERQVRKTEKLLKNAKVLHGKTLDNFKLSEQPSLSPGRVRELAEGDFLDRCENILVFGIPGAGKSHLASALGREWCLRGRRVLYIPAAMLVQNLLVAKKNLRLQELIKELDKCEALIIDDISYIPFTREETDVLFVLLSARYETRSVVITSNLVFSDWGAIFKDPMTTMAAIDRLVHHATFLELKKSYRQAEAKRRNEAPETEKLARPESPPERQPKTKRNKIIEHIQE